MVIVIQIFIDDDGDTSFEKNCAKDILLSSYKGTMFYSNFYNQRVHVTAPHLFFDSQASKFVPVKYGTKEVMFAPKKAFRSKGHK